jgi:hypothetical protein
MEATSIHGDKSHQAVSSYFIGPRAENLGDFRVNIESILNELKNARQSYFPDDPVSVSRLFSPIPLPDIIILHPNHQPTEY